MNQETKEIIKKASAAVPATAKPRLFNVDVLLGKNICGSLQVKANDPEHAKERAFIQLDFKVKKAY